MCRYSLCALSSSCLVEFELRTDFLFVSLSLRRQLGNKSDLPQALSIEDLIKEMKLDKITNRPVSVRFSASPIERCPPELTWSFFRWMGTGLRLEHEDPAQHRHHPQLALATREMRTFYPVNNPPAASETRLTCVRVGLSKDCGRPFSCTPPFVPSSPLLFFLVHTFRSGSPTLAVVLLPGHPF